MKNILVPTDFSECSVNALKYAAELSKFTHSKIYFLHVYQPLIPATDIPVMEIVPVEEMEKGFRKEMNHIIIRQKEKIDWDASVTIMNKAGITSAEINNTVEEKQIDLVIMGMRGKTHPLGKFFGSTATDMIKKANCPLLLVPENTDFHVPDRIAIAFDIKHPEDITKISVAKEFTRLFKAKLLAFSIIGEEAHNASEKAVVYDAVDKMLSDYQHSIHFNVHHDVTEGILSFLDEHKAKMLVMFHHSHNLFARIFSTITSKEISFDTKVPLLVVNEKANTFRPIAL